MTALFNNQESFEIRCLRHLVIYRKIGRFFQSDFSL